MEDIKTRLSYYKRIVETASTIRKRKPLDKEVIYDIHERALEKTRQIANSTDFKDAKEQMFAFIKAEGVRLRLWGCYLNKVYQQKTQ